MAVWGQRPERATTTAAEVAALVGHGVKVYVVSSLEDGVQAADIVCSATSSSSVQPLLKGDWLRRGTFINLVGSFSPERREADDETVRRSRIFVDAFDIALAEAADLLDPLQRGVLSRERIEADLAGLVTGRAAGRRDDEEITLFKFKSVGSAIEDLAATT